MSIISVLKIRDIMLSERSLSDNWDTLPQFFIYQIDQRKRHKLLSFEHSFNAAENFSDMREDRICFQLSCL
jgi:hypothetical protein